MIVSLVGFRGAGKSTVGRLAAARLGASFLDSDEAIVAAAGGTSVAALFEREGEGGFRRREEEALESLLGRPPAGGRAVLATGGGAVLSSVNRERMRAAGLVFWLDAAAATLRERIASDPATAANRPALRGGAGGDALAEIEEILAAREPLYRAAAHERIVVDGRSAEAVADEVVLLLRARAR